MNSVKLKNIIIISIMLLITARYLAAGWNRILRNSNSADGDQAAYLQLGLDVREHGQLTDGKRNPLFPVILASFAQREWSYFTWAKILNFAVGLVTIWAVFLIGRRLFEPVTGVVAALLLSINIEFIAHATFALAESLLILTVLLAWYAMVRALREPDHLSYWVLGGGLAGLAYLAKGTGPLIAICFVLTVGLLFGYRIFTRRVFWSFVVGFVVISLPLWLYNWVNFGSPIFNSAVNNVMWMDSATEKYVADTSNLPTFSTYFQDKSLGEVWERLSEGLLAMRYYFARLLWPTRSLIFDRYFQAGWIDLIFLSVFFLAVLSMKFLAPVFRRYREALLLTAVMVLVFYFLFGWYIAISPFPIRFILPLAPVLFLLLSAGAVGLLRAVFAAPRVPRWTKVALAIAVFVVVLRPVGWFAVSGYLIVSQSLQNAFRADAEFNSYTEQSLRWVRSGHEEDETVTVMWGPTHMLPVWRHSDTLNLLRTPVAEARNTNDLESFMATNDVAYIVVDSEMVSRMGRDHAAKWGISTLDNGRVELGDYPSDWALGFAGPEMPCQWCVFRRLDATPIINAIDYQLGDSIILFGYELDKVDYVAGGQLVVTLYWQAEQSVAGNYTVFTQLLGPDYQLHGQMDRPPLSGVWPTGRWLPQQKFVDKFILEIDEAAPAGDYVLLVGLYDGNTGQRLPVSVNGERLHDDAIPLSHFALSEAEARAQ